LDTRWPAARPREALLDIEDDRIFRSAPKRIDSGGNMVKTKTYTMSEKGHHTQQTARKGNTVTNDKEKEKP
jgi:hypothetical protein